MSDRKTRTTVNLAVALVFVGAGMIALSAVTTTAAQAASTQAASQPNSIPEAVGQAVSVWQLVAGGKYREGIAVGLMLLVWAWRRYLGAYLIGKLSPWGVGFATVLLGFVATLPAALLAEQFSWGRFVWESLVTSAEAMLFWQMIWKRLPWSRQVAS